jgi:hypothetical protein
MSSNFSGPYQRFNGLSGGGATHATTVANEQIVSAFEVESSKTNIMQLIANAH